MPQTILVTLLAITLELASGCPLQTCDKLKDVKEGADNYDQYLIKLKDSDNYMNAEYVIKLVNQYQAILEHHAYNVHESSIIRSQLELSENTGMLYGTLSQQVFIFGKKLTSWLAIKYNFDACQVCSETRFIQITQETLLTLRVQLWAQVKPRMHTLEIVLNLTSNSHTMVTTIRLPSSEKHHLISFTVLLL